MTEQPLIPGLHEQLMTKGMQAALDVEDELRAEVAKVDPADQPHVLARHVHELTRPAFEARADPDGRIQLLNDVVALLEAPAGCRCRVNPDPLVPLGFGKEGVSFRPALTRANSTPGTPVASARSAGSRRGRHRIGSA